jgi:hypothetical protein
MLAQPEMNSDLRTQKKAEGEEKEKKNATVRGRLLNHTGSGVQV